MKKKQHPNFWITLKSQQINFFKNTLFLLFLLGGISMSESFAQGNKFGQVVPTTNKALISSYNYQEYVFPVINDAATCKGIANASAKIEKVYFAQTHRLEVGYPFFFLVGQRPALLQIGITGSGNSPDVKVEGFFNGQSLGTKCLAGPTTLSASVDYSQANFTKYFSVTLPKEWIKPGFSIKVQAGTAVRTISSADLKIFPPTEVNLITIPVDVLDYNTSSANFAVPDDLIYNLAGSLPASVIRVGNVPFRIKAPVIISSHSDAVPKKITSKNDLQGLSKTIINASSLRIVQAFQDASGESSFSFFYGNTPNFFDGGFGGDKRFIGSDYDGIFIHEFGHALSLPHWGEGAYGSTNTNENYYSYPYGGVGNDGGGRGDSWSFYQNVNEFVDPICRIAGDQNIGEERSDAMQRNNSCLEKRSYGNGPWDGFGDFSAIAINRNLVGATDISGQVPYKGGSVYYHLSKQNGFPTLKLDSQGNRIIVRDALQPQTPDNNEKLDFLVPKQWNVPVHYISGTAHLTYPEANLIYEPVTYTGGMPALIDPTDSATFAKLKDESSYNGYFYWDKDLTIRYTYADGTVKHALHVHASPERDLGTDYDYWRYDLAYFGIIVPGDKPLKKVEVFKRLFNVRDASDSRPGNINYAPNNITAANFMEGATLLSTLNVANSPQIAFTSPQPFTVLSPSSSVNLAATASDSNGTVKKVDFYNGNTLLGSDTTVPYTYELKSLAVGAYNISAIATDNEGQTTKAYIKFGVAAPVCNASAVRIPIIKVLGTLGSLGNNDEHVKETVFDTDITTYFDAREVETAWVGIDAGSDYKLTNIGFYPRDGWNGRMTEGKFQASNKEDFSSGVVDLYTITSAPDYKWNCIPVNNSNSFRYFRYVSSEGSNCNVSEIVFQGVKAASASNQSPTDILLSSTMVKENQPIGTVVGKFSTVDPNNGDTFTYTLQLAGQNNDIASFYIDEDQLKTNAVFNYATKSNYRIKVRSTDQGGLFNEKWFDYIAVIKGNDTKPTLSFTKPLNDQQFKQGEPVNVVVNAADSDGSVVKVALYLDGNFVREENLSPFEWSDPPLNSLSVGVHTLKSIVTDNDGNTAETSIVINVGGAIVSGQIYRLVARHSGKVLDVSNCSSEDGANVQQWPLNGANCQKWKINATDNGYYSLISQQSGKALDVSTCGTADGQNVHQWVYHGGDCQQWKIEPTDNGYFRLLARNSGKALDVAGTSTEDGANVIIWPYHGGNGQQWKVEAIGTQTSKISSGKIENESETNLTVYKGSSEGIVNLLFDLTALGKYKLRVFNLVGVVVHKETLDVSKNQFTKELDLTKLPKGTYILKLESENQIITKKIML